MRETIRVILLTVICWAWICGVVALIGGIDFMKAAFYVSCSFIYLCILPIVAWVIFKLTEE